MIAITTWDVLITSPIAFIGGVIVGLGVSSRWRIIRRRNGWDDH